MKWQRLCLTLLEEIQYTRATNFSVVNVTNGGVLVKYADDATYVVSSRLRVNNQLKMNINLAKLKEFLNNNELAINTSKTAIQENMIKPKKGKIAGDPPTSDSEESRQTREINEDQGQ